MSQTCPYCGKAAKSRGWQELKIYWARLRDISEQVVIEGRRYAPEAWHEQFKRQFIGCIDLPNGQTQGMTTAILNDEEMRSYRWQIEEYAQLDFGVRFTEAADWIDGGK